MKPGWPAAVLLHQWGMQLERVFGATAYCVGSCAKGKKKWRDVDVVVMLEDDEFRRWFGPYGDSTGAPVWEAVCLSFSLWGQKVTGLPIDFKVQRKTSANEQHDGPRSALGKMHGQMHVSLLNESKGRDMGKEPKE